MLKSWLLLSLISSITGYYYSGVHPTYLHSPHHPKVYSPYAYHYPLLYHPSPQLYNPSYQPWANHPSHQASQKLYYPSPQLYHPSYQPWAAPVSQGLDEVDPQFNQQQPRFFFGSQLSGDMTRGTLNGSVVVQQNIFLGNSGNNAIFSLSLDGGTEADTKYAALLVEEALADTFCGSAASRQSLATRQAVSFALDGNTLLASLVAEGLGLYDVKRAGIWLKGTMLKHNVDGNGEYDGTYPTGGFLNYFNGFASVTAQLSGLSYTPATTAAVTGNKISAKGKWFVILKIKSSFVDVDVGCAKLE